MSLALTDLNAERLQAASAAARKALLAARDESGHWLGELATSALATATAVSALALVMKAESLSVAESAATTADGHLQNPTPSPIPALVRGGIKWLAEQQNLDGGWGDTEASYSNISTTLLAIAAFRLAGVAEQHGDRLRRADQFVDSKGRWAGLRRRYGRDKTFAVPILTNCALAGMVDWHEVSPLPFELACFPQSMYRMLQLPVVSYAIPALVAIGQARFFHRPPWNPLVRGIRARLVEKSSRVLEKMQPASGGYLEAVPLTSFVVMSMAATGRAAAAVTQDGVRFLIDSVRSDGSWPIDSNLATWNTTLSLNALAAGDTDIAEQKCLDWLLNCQTKQTHPFTGAAPGGWGWSDLTGSVPDADDTPSALLTLATWSRSRKCSGRDRRRIRDAAAAGIRWLLGLQNRNGGWATFCRGWGKLPFDRSGADLTAHAIRALHAWRDLVDASRPIQRGLKYLARAQQADGSWVPLWFGNQDHPREENPVYGTSKVLLAYRDLGRLDSEPARRGLAWLVANQNADAGWGGGPSLDPTGSRSTVSSVEETALAVEALLAEHAAGQECPANSRDAIEAAPIEESQTRSQRLLRSKGGEMLAGVEAAAVPNAAIPRAELVRGLDWLVRAVESDHFRQASPIGFYFAKLWYHEKLYPIIFATSVLGQAVRLWPALAVRSSPANSCLMSATADNPLFTERTKLNRQPAASGDDVSVTSVHSIKQPCP